jgi:hypothetical protein
MSAESRAAEDAAGRDRWLAGHVARLVDLLDRGFEVDGEAVLCERMTWVIYGRTTYDGEMILAEFSHEEDALEVIRLVSRGTPWMLSRANVPEV